MWYVGQTVELCSGPPDDCDVLGERTIAKIKEHHVVLSSGSKVRMDGTLVGHAMHIRAKEKPNA